VQSRIIGYSRIFFKSYSRTVKLITQMHVAINLIMLTNGGIFMIGLRLHLVFKNLESWILFLLDRRPEVGYF